MRTLTLRLLKISKTISNILKVALSLLLGGAILYWMYRDFDFSDIKDVLLHGMNWTWMLLSFPFGILAQTFRGWRWRMTLEPMNEHSRGKVRVSAVFLSYASSLIVPRIGEFARCAVLSHYDGVSFAKAFGTVIVERAVDTLLLMAVCVFAFVCQFAVFDKFFASTGTNIGARIAGFTTTGYVVTALCAVAVLLMAWYALRRFAIYNKVKAAAVGVWRGIMSIGSVRSIPMFAIMTLAIWLCYFLHYYLTFFCFDATAGLGVGCALSTFVIGSIAVIVPTPNGAGPWHFAVKTMLVLYGVGIADALYFVLIVHAVQTLLVVILGIIGWIALAFTKCTTQKSNLYQPL